MGHDKPLFELVRHPLKVRTLAVRRVQAITPRMRRITLAGPELEGFTTLAPEDHVKVFFPREGDERPVLPSFGPLGVKLPSFGPKPVARDYTPRRYDAEKGELELDFYLHGSGVAATWAARAAPGQLLGVAGPRGSFVLTREFDHHLFVGDETALPEFARRIEELPARARAVVVAVVNGQEDEIALQGECAIDVHWMHRPAQGDASPKLVRALAELPLPEGFAWLAGEADEMKNVLRVLALRGFPRAHTRVSGHWKRGVINHDHHEPVSLDAP